MLQFIYETFHPILVYFLRYTLMVIIVIIQYCVVIVVMMVMALPTRKVSGNIACAIEYHVALISR